MHAPDCHLGSHHQSLGSNQALSYQGLHRARIQQHLVFTPLHPYRNAVRPLRTVSRGRRANHLDHLPHLHERALVAEVAQLSAPPTLRSGRLRVKRQVEVALALGERRRAPNEGEASFEALALASPAVCGRGAGRGDPRPRLRRPRDWRAGGIVPRPPWLWVAPPETAPGPPPRLRRPPSVSPAAATSLPGRSAVAHRRRGSPPLPGPAPGTAASAPPGCTPSGPARPFGCSHNAPALMGEGCGLPAVPPPTKAVAGVPPAPPVGNGRLRLPPRMPPKMPGRRRPLTFLGDESSGFFLWCSPRAPASC